LSLQHHFDIVTSEDVAQFPELFGAIGQAFYDRKMYDSALDVYQLMAENEEVGPFFHTVEDGGCAVTAC
jgi:hypothetical protein